MTVPETDTVMGDSASGSEKQVPLGLQIRTACGSVLSQKFDKN
jgi:hypothetical protein